MKLFRTFFIIAIFVCFVFIIMNCHTGCSRRITAPALQVDQECNPPPESDVLSANIYLDCSASMKGFVSTFDTSYIQLIHSLERAFVGGWTASTTRFKKFGIEVELMPVQSVLTASSPNFYSDMETHIERAIEDANPESFNVIITDLYQYNNDLINLVKKLRDKFLQKNLEIGLLGIKSQFNGIIYDSGPGGTFPKFKYNGTRPFYVLMIGKHFDIVNYYERLKSRNNFKVDSNFIILFSRYLVNPPILFSDSKISSTSNLAMDPSLVTPGINDKLLKSFNIVNSSRRGFSLFSKKNPNSGGRETSFKAEFNYNPLKHIMKFKENSLETIIIPKRLKNNVFVDDPGSVRGLQVHDIEISEQSGLSFKTEISPNYLIGKGIYQFEIIIQPPSSAYDIPPAFLANWNSDQPSQDGSRTLNLSNFSKDLWDATTKVCQPKIADLFCYLKKK
jgi:hypothetical protein